MGALLGVAAGALVLSKLQAARAAAAGIALYNELAEQPDPATLTREQVRESLASIGVELDKIAL